MSTRAEVEHLKNTILQQQAAIDMQQVQMNSEHLRHVSELQEVHRADMLALRDELKAHYSGQLRQALLKMKDRYIGSLRALAPNLDTHAVAAASAASSSAFVAAAAEAASASAAATVSPVRRHQREGRRRRDQKTKGASSPTRSRSRSPTKASGGAPSYAQTTASSRAKSPARK